MSNIYEVELFYSNEPQKVDDYVKLPLDNFQFTIDDYLYDKEIKSVLFRKNGVY